MPGARKLGRSTDHRKAMLRAMVTFLMENGKIETTVTSAKEVRSTPSMPTVTAATPASYRSAPAAATPQRWPSSS